LIKIKGCIWGNALGDAIGLASENMTKSIAQIHYAKKELSLDDFEDDGHRQKWSIGDWTDDTDQMCCILNCIIKDFGEVNEKNFAEELQNWSRHGFPELGDMIGRGIGVTIGSVLNHPEYLTDPHKASYDVWVSRSKSLASNGAVMRTSILGIPCFDNLDKVIENSVKIAKATHYDSRCVASSVAVTVAIALMLQGKLDANSPEELEKILEISTEKSVTLLNEKELPGESKEELKNCIRTKNLSELKLDEEGKIGFTYKCLGSAFYCFTQGKDFKQAITELVLEGGDADTNGAVAGALLGCKLGYNKLPKDWLDGLLENEWLEFRVQKLLVLLGLST